jgi:hypothetical protein
VDGGVGGHAAQGRPVVGEGVAGEAPPLHLVLAGGVERQVDERLARGELRVDGDAEQAALLAGRDLHRRRRRRQQAPVGRDDPDAAGALGDQRAAVGQERDVPRHAQAAGDHRHLGPALGADGRRLDPRGRQQAGERQRRDERCQDAAG